MGGKHKQPQRIKNNARPSNSGRSAELLGTSIPQFVGFSSVKESGMVIPGLALSTDDIDSSIDSNFQLVLKKMNKKDSTTKLKALQEFTELLKTTEIEAIKAVLPFWPRLYCALATDTDHKVREATHVAHHQVVLKAKRNLAPFLKQLSGPWFTSQYDTYAPAASVAKRSFQDAFPSNKVQEAIVFCQEEILSYICENLTIHTVQTLSNSKTTLPEDAEAKYQRVLISSLHGYTLYLNTVSTENVEKQSDLNLQIISHSKFWKLAKHKVAAIRSAWFGVIAALCQKSPLLREKELAHIVGSVFANLDEREPIVLPAVWETALSVFSTVNDWWKHISVEKLVLPKLYKVLREGGQGNASVIYPNLLPLISHIPQISDMNSVYISIFENMRAGLKNKSVTGSRSESTAVSIAFVECLQYIILKNQNDLALCEKLIKMQLFALLEWSLTDLQAPYKVVFNQTTTLIQYLNRNCNNPQLYNYSKYLDYFWNNLGSLFEGLLLNFEHSVDLEAASRLAERQIEFLLSLKHTVKPRKHLKVTFIAENQSENVHTHKDDCVDKVDANHREYLESLNGIAYKTCKNLVKFIEEKRSKQLLEHLVHLVQEFNSENYFSYLKSQLGIESETSLIGIHRKLLVRWLNSKILCSKAVVDLIFLLFKYLNSEEKTEVLNDFNKQETCLGWCIAQALSHPYHLDVTVQIWLQNEQISKFLVTIMEKELSDECIPELSLILKQAFTEKPNGELFISKEAVHGVVRTLSKSLVDPTDYTITVDTCASFAAYISAILYTANFKLRYGDELFLAMFTLLSSPSIDSEWLSKDTFWEMKTAWQDAVRILARELSLSDFEKLTLKCADILERQVLVNNRNEIDDNIIDLIIDFIKCLQSNNPLRINNALALLLNRKFVEEWKESLTNVCIKAEFIEGNLCSPFQSIKEQKDDYISEDKIIHYFTWMDLVGQILTKPIINDEDDAEIELVVKMVEISGDIENLIVDLFYTFALANSFTKCYQCTKHSSKVALKGNSIKVHMKKLVEIMDKEFADKIESVLIKKSFSNNWLWISTVHTLYSEILDKDLSESFTKLLNKDDIEKSPLTRLHLVQTFAKSINYDHVRENLSLIESFIVLRSLIRSDELDVQIAEAFSKISNLKQQNHAKFICDSGVLQYLTWSDTETVVEIMRLYASILKHKPHTIQLDRFDLILVPFALWSTNIVKNRTKFSELQVSSFIAALSELFISTAQHMQTCDKEQIVNEWRDVFAQDVHKSLIEIWLSVCEKYQGTSNQFHITDLPFLQKFGNAVPYFDYVYLFNRKHPNTPKWSKLLKHCFSLLTQRVGCLQLWGYRMLIVLLPGLVEVDSVAVNTNTPHEKGLIFEQFKSVLCHMQDVVQSMLIEFRLGEDSCRVEPFTDSYTYTFAYFLIWDILLALCEKSSTELCYQYADWLKNEDFLSTLLNSVFKLMPIEIMHAAEVKAKQYSNLFTTKFCASLTAVCSSEKIEHMVCWIYLSALSQLSPLVRQWWGQQDTRISQIVERVTAMFVSPQLCQQELMDVAQRAQNDAKFKNMVVKVHPSVREVVAIYTVDEAQMELVITLPNNYPLKGPEVQCNKQIYGTSHRQWLMQLTMCVQHQNGRIWDGLSLWNNNLDKKFDGVEECYICFAILHQGTYQLPKLTCQTCKKKFHSACLYKWFSTSNKSTCPICRHLF